MSPATADPQVDQSGMRESFNDGWLFERFGPMPDGSTRIEPMGLEAVNLPDDQWRKLNLPHDWGIEGPFRLDLPSSTGKLPWAGVGWYRKHFRVSPGDKGKLFFVDFDGAMSHAKVWLNGKYLGEWPYGYASFRLEVTPAIHFDKENLLAVRLENPSNSSRWYPGGGIYRNVCLVKTSPVHVTHWGTFVTIPEIDSNHATVHVRTEIVNQSGATSDVQVLFQIDEIGQPISIASAPIAALEISAAEKRICEVNIAVPSPMFWSLESPHLYFAKTSIFVNGRLADVDNVPFGIRTIKFSTDSGFVLNGRRVRIQGVCNHHDLGILGTAVNTRALERQIELLQEMGCNAIRTSHNPPAPELLDLCDRMGMLVLDEAFDCWIKGKTPNDYSTLFEEWHEKDLRALVERDRNHPCVIAWSAGNEISEQENGNLVGQLRVIIRKYDDTRPVTAACNDPNAGFDGFQNAVDIFGYNYNPHLYSKFRATNPFKPLFGSETASCISSFGEYFFPLNFEKSGGAFSSQVTSYDLSAPPWATIPDSEFAAEDRNPFVAGEFVWSGFDYLGEPTPYGDDTSHSRSSYFGILDLCGFKKDRFYLYQSRWRPDLPMAHILPHWNWPDRIGKITPVHVYTSGDEAELFLNGTSLGRKRLEPFVYRLRWDEVRYRPGVLKVVAYKAGKLWAEDSVKTTGDAIKLQLFADRTVVKPDGRDLIFVTVEVQDKEGMEVPSAENPVQFQINGPGVVAAVGNGDPTDFGSFESDRTKVFHGQCLVIVSSVHGKTGKIVLSAISAGLSPASVDLSAN